MRGKFNRTIVAANSGAVVPYAMVDVFDQATGDRVDIYSSQTGGTPISNPFESTSLGFVSFFLDAGQYRFVARSAGGAFISEITHEVVVDPSIASGIYDVIEKTGTNENIDYKGISLRYLQMTNSSAKTLTFRPFSSFEIGVGEVFNIRNSGAGLLTVIAGSGVTINPPTSGVLTIEQNGSAAVICVAENEYDMIGIAARNDLIETWADISTVTPTAAGQLFTLKQHTSGGLGGGTLMAFVGLVTDDGGTQKNCLGGFYLKRVGYDFVTPEMFGAIPNGIIDCSPALQSAWESKYEVRLSVGVYNLFTPINMTNYAGGGKTVRGQGWGQSGNGSVLRANTGGVCLDLTGSQNITLSDFCIDAVYNAPPYAGDLSTPSNIGILYARSTTSPYCQFCTLENIYIYIPTSSSFGGRGGVGIYNNSAEIHHYNNIYVIADTPLATVTYNPWGVTSPFQTIETGIISMSMITLTGTSTLHGLKLTQQAWYANNAFGLCAENLYALGIGAAVLNMDGCNNINVSGHIEGFDRVAILKNTKGARLKFTNPPQNQSPIYIGATFAGLFDLDLQLDGVSNTWPQIIEGDVTSILNNIAINLSDDDGSRPLTNIAASNVKCVTRRTIGALGGLKNVSLVDAKVVLYMEFVPIVDTQAINGSLFLDSATSKLSFKSGGTVFPLY